MAVFGGWRLNVHNECEGLVFSRLTVVATAAQQRHRPALPVRMLDLECNETCALLLAPKARRSALDHHVYRTPRLGAQVLITEHWYYGPNRSSPKRHGQIRRATAHLLRYCSGMTL